MLDNFAEVEVRGAAQAAQPADTPAPQDIWQASEEISRRLLGWNMLNLVGGALASLLAGKNYRLRGVAGQAVGWGMINAAIAILGRKATRQRALKPDARRPERLRKEARNLRVLLWVNAGLDVLYMIGGLALARRAKGDTPKAEMQRGTGLGIVMQGAFLFIFDLIHAFRVPDPT